MTCSRGTCQECRGPGRDQPGPGSFPPGSSATAGQVAPYSQPGCGPLWPDLAVASSGSTLLKAQTAFLVELTCALLSLEREWKGEFISIHPSPPGRGLGLLAAPLGGRPRFQHRSPDSSTPALAPPLSSQNWVLGLGMRLPTWASLASNLTPRSSHPTAPNTHISLAFASLSKISVWKLEGVKPAGKISRADLPGVSALKSGFLQGIVILNRGC